MAIIFSPFSSDQVKKISETIERRIKWTKSGYILLTGVCLAAISLVTFLFSSSFSGTKTVTGYELIIRYQLKTAIGFAFLHVLTLIVLVVPKLLDKFRYATLFALVNILLLFLVYAYEAPRAIRDFRGFSGLSFIALLLCWILFDLETYKTKSKNPLFIFISLVNDKIQYLYDEYAMLDYRKAIKKYKARHKS